MKPPALRATCFAALLAAVPGVAAQASSVSVYLSAPFTETAGSSGLPTSDGTSTGTPTSPANTPNTLGFAGVSTETFDSPVTTGTYHTLTSTSLSNSTFVTAAGNAGFSVLANGQYGGGGQGNYLGVNNGSPVTLTFNTPEGYFGVLWCAVDSGNSLTFYDQNNVAIGTFNASTFSNLLPTAGSITALNGTAYNTANYYGQPTGTTSTANRSNGSQQYAYLNFVAQAGTTISKIVETQTTTGGTFESDNYSILATAPTVNSTSYGDLVFVTTVPEPATWTLAVVAGGLMLLGVRRRMLSQPG